MAIQEGGRFTPNDRIVSPGVFSRELDQSFLAQGVQDIGGAVVAPFPRGPGFSPTIIRSQADLEAIFGTPDGVLYGPYTAQQYLQEQGAVTIVRVGGLGGYTQNNPLAIKAVPGQYLRFQESSSFTGTLLGATVTNTGPGTFNLVGSLVATFGAGIYSGSTVVVGLVSGSIDAGDISGSFPNQSFTSGSFVLTVSDAQVGHTGVLTVSASLDIVQVNPCTTSYNVAGLMTGSYGAFDLSSWVAASVPVLIDCNTIVTGSSGRNVTTLAVLANTAYDTGQTLAGFSGSVLVSSSLGLSPDFSLVLSSSVGGGYGIYGFSLDSASPRYITRVFGTDPKAGFIPVATGQKIDVAYLYRIFNNAIDTVVPEMLASGSWRIEVAPYNDATILTDGVTPDVGNSLFDLRQAETPWVNSQVMASWTGSYGPGVNRFNLFKVHTMADGTDTNTRYKIEISNVKSPGTVPGTPYGTFTLAVRDYNDSDKKPSFLEIYNNLNLDPNSADFIARRIGDRYNFINYNGKILEFGDYENKSRFIRIEMATNPWPTEAIPYGFDAYAAPVGGELSSLATLPKMTFTSASIYSLAPGKYASGIVFQPAPAGSDDELESLYPNGTQVGSERDNKQYFAPVPVGADKGANCPFDLEEVCGIPPIYIANSEITNTKMRKFVFGFQAGFDGQSPSVPVLVGNDIITTNQQGLNCATNTSTGSYAYKQAITALSNADEFDINLIVVPGINYQYNPYVSTLCVEMCETRGDCFYIMDIAPNQLAGASSLDNVVSLASEFDTNYAATYYPWVKIRDTNTNRIIPVPPSVVLPAVYAASDRVAAEWFAPAGLNRGGIPTAVQVVDRLTHAERDQLYEGRVNPIAAFPGSGVSVWGQKTLQVKPSALDRINVRRLLIALKKFIAGSSRYLIFEQNVSSTRNRFLNIVNPYLESVQQRSGLYAFRVVMDETNNTPDVVDRNILYGQIYLQPAKTAEFIILDFNVMPTGASFGNEG
jgi:hypothetical protein